MIEKREDFDFVENSLHRLEILDSGLLDAFDGYFLSSQFMIGFVDLSISSLPDQLIDVIKTQFGLEILQNSFFEKFFNFFRDSIDIVFLVGSEN